MGQGPGGQPCTPAPGTPAPGTPARPGPVRMQQEDVVWGHSTGTRCGDTAQGHAAGSGSEQGSEVSKSWGSWMVGLEVLMLLICIDFLAHLHIDGLGCPEGQLGSACTAETCPVSRSCSSPASPEAAETRTSPVRAGTGGEGQPTGGCAEPWCQGRGCTGSHGAGVTGKKEKGAARRER